MHLRHLSNLLLVSKAVDTIEPAGGFHGARIASEQSYFKMIFVVMMFLHPAWGHVVKEATGLPKICPGSQEQGFAE